MDPRVNQAAHVSKQDWRQESGLNLKRLLSWTAIVLALVISWRAADTALGRLAAGTVHAQKLHRLALALQFAGLDGVRVGWRRRLRPVDLQPC